MVLAGVAKSTWNFHRVERVGVRSSRTVVGRAGGRRGRAVEIGGQEAAEALLELEALLRRRGAGEHRGRSKAQARPPTKVLPVEHVVGDVVGVRPDAQLRVVVEVRLRERVAVVCAGGVGGGGDGDALQIWAAWLTENCVRTQRSAALSYCDDRVAVVVGLAVAVAAEAAQSVLPAWESRRRLRRWSC